MTTHLDRITAAEIDDMGFTVRYIRPGYDMDEVDLVLDGCADTLTVHQRNTSEIRGLAVKALHESLGRGPLDPARRLSMQILSLLDEPDWDNAGADDSEAVA